jgi:hypothetical protein
MDEQTPYTDDNDTQLNSDLKKALYNTEQAYEFYREFIYNVEHQAVIREHGFHVAGSIAPKNWEVFAAILTGDHAKGSYGSDLEHHEVKSSVNGNSFEYQYHLNGGQTKLKEDMVVNHIFVSYSDDYKDIEVRLVEGVKLKPTFEVWLPGLIANYDGPNRKQRYRKAIAYGFVKENGVLILKTQDGHLI